MCYILSSPLFFKKRRENNSFITIMNSFTAEDCCTPYFSSAAAFLLIFLSLMLIILIMGYFYEDRCCIPVEHVNSEVDECNHHHMPSPPQFYEKEFSHFFTSKFGASSTIHSLPLFLSSFTSKSSYSPSA